MQHTYGPALTSVQFVCPTAHAGVPPGVIPALFVSNLCSTQQKQCAKTVAESFSLQSEWGSQTERK